MFLQFGTTPGCVGRQRTPCPPVLDPVRVSATPPVGHVGLKSPFRSMWPRPPHLPPDASRSAVVVGTLKNVFGEQCYKKTLAHTLKFKYPQQASWLLSQPIRGAAAANVEDVAGAPECEHGADTEPSVYKKEDGSDRLRVVRDALAKRLRGHPNG